MFFVLLRCLYQYEIANPLDARLPLARLRIEMGTIFLELSADISLRSSMCDSVVGAIILMCLTREPWLKAASLRLIQ